MMEKDRFKAVWLPLSGGFYRVAFSILGSEADARDAVQDLFVKLWNIRNQLDSVRSPEAYGIRLVKNICIDRLRSREVKGIAEDISAVREDRIASWKDAVAADSRVIGKETADALERALSRLPENQRTVMRMRFFQQLDYGDIAKQTGFSMANVRVLVARARRTVIEDMKDFL